MVYSALQGLYYLAAKNVYYGGTQVYSHRKTTERPLTTSLALSVDNRISLTFTLLFAREMVTDDWQQFGMVLLLSLTVCAWLSLPSNHHRVHETRSIQTPTYY